MILGDALLANLLFSENAEMTKVHALASANAYLAVTADRISTCVLQVMLRFVLDAAYLSIASQTSQSLPLAWEVDTARHIRLKSMNHNFINASLFQLLVDQDQKGLDFACPVMKGYMKGLIYNGCNTHLLTAVSW